jgi:mono/diheme cytochrome c family protein
MKLERLLFALILSFFLAGCGFSLAADITPPPGSELPASNPTQTEPAADPLYPLLPPSPAAGREIYDEKCAPCHGPQGMGDGDRAPSLPNPVTAIGSANIARLAAPAKWFKVISEGNLERFMPPFPSLSERQRWDVIAYTYSLNATADSIAQGKDLYQKECARCHGVEGKGDGPDAANLNATPRDFTDQEFMAGKSTSDFYQAITDGVSPSMPGFESQLSELDRSLLADYLRWLTFSEGGEAAALEGTLSSSDTAPTPDSAPMSEITPTLEITETLNLGVITGTVINSSGGDIPIGTEVILHGFDEMQMVISNTTTLNPDGTYVFSDTETIVGRAFFTTLQFKDITYGSDVVVAEGEGQNLDLPISVFDTTTDTKDLKVDRLHLFFEPLDEDNIRVAELYIISNNGNKTVVPTESGKPTLLFDLPEGASDLRFQEGALGERFIQSGRGFGDLYPVYPGAGSYQVLLDYILPYKSKLDLSQTMTLPTDAIVIMVPQDSYKIKGKNLEQTNNREVQGVSFEMYNRNGLPSGELLRLTVSGKPGGTFFTSSSGNNLVIGLGAFLVVLFMVGGWVFFRNRRANEPQEADVAEEISNKTKGETPETLMDAILALDDLYQAGELPEQAYIERRAALKTQLKDLLDKEQGK